MRARGARFQTAIVSLAVMTGAALARDADVTILVGGDLWTHGGVVAVHPVAVEPERWEALERAGTSSRVRVDARYAEVQLRYPGRPNGNTGRFTYRFRPAPGVELPKAPPAGGPVRTLSVIGVDENGVAARMTEGFGGEPSTGGRVHRIAPFGEWAGADEATRSAAAWGETTGPLPPADERSARVLASIVRGGSKDVALKCRGDALVQVCTVAEGDREALRLR